MREPLSSATRQISALIEGRHETPEAQTNDEVSRPVVAVRKQAANFTKPIVPLGTFRLLWLRFFRDFSSAVRRMPEYNSKDEARPASASVMVA